MDSAAAVVVVAKRPHETRTVVVCTKKSCKRTAIRILMAMPKNQSMRPAANQWKIWKSSICYGENDHIFVLFSICFCKVNVLNFLIFPLSFSCAAVWDWRIECNVKRHWLNLVGASNWPHRIYLKIVFNLQGTLSIEHSSMLLCQHLYIWIKYTGSNKRTCHDTISHSAEVWICVGSIHGTNNQLNLNARAKFYRTKSKSKLEQKERKTMETNSLNTLFLLE